MVSPLNPTKYTGPDVFLANYVIRPRRPTVDDVRQPGNAKLYPISCIWQVGKNPLNGTEGELWILSKIVANQATWIMIGSGSGSVVSLTGDIGPPVFPDDDGNIDVIGGNAETNSIFGIQARGGIGDETLTVELTNRIAVTTFTIGAETKAPITFPTTPPLDDGGYKLKCEISVFNQTDGNSGSGFEIEQMITVSSGSITLQGTPIKNMVGTDPSFNVTMVDLQPGGGFMELQITGLSGKNLLWGCVLTYLYSG